jgi:hypothetical protein
MKNDAVLKIAICLYSNPGAYALLLGSGISIATGIPTGRNIETSLIRMIAAIRKSDPLPDERTWYQNTFGEPPVYDDLMNKLTSTPAERMVLLRSYIEPNEQEREDGRKTPTKAHRAIASLVQTGFIRLILTTNFDRLTEQALEELGIHPYIIASDAQIDSTVPYSIDGKRCYVVKVHGDYQSTDIRNTGQELESYSPNMDAYLDHIFNDFGLIICGWSGAIDQALRKSLVREPGKHFSTFWLTRETLNAPAANVATERQADEVAIQSANDFFVELNEHMESLRAMSQGRPIDVATAVETTKRYIPEGRYRVRLHDLIFDEARGVHEELKQTGYLPNEAIHPRIKRYEVLTKKLMAMTANLSYHDAGENAGVLKKCVELLIDLPQQHGADAYPYLRFYPALLVVYACGIYAVAAKRYRNLSAVIREPTYREPFSGLKRSAIEVLFPFHSKVFGYINMGTLSPILSLVPAHTYLFSVVQDTVSLYLPTEASYIESFDWFECLVALTYTEFARGVPFLHLNLMNKSIPQSRDWSDLINPVWSSSPLGEIERAERTQGSDMDLLRAGFFRNSPKLLRNVLIRYRAGTAMQDEDYS